MLDDDEIVVAFALDTLTAHGKRDTWPEWEAQAEVHAVAPDLAPRTMGYVAVDDADQPTTTFVRYGSKRA